MLTQHVWSDEWNQWQAWSRDSAARHPEQVRLIEVEAGHDINTHLQLI